MLSYGGAVLGKVYSSSCTQTVEVKEISRRGQVEVKEMKRVVIYELTVAGQNTCTKLSWI